VEVFGWKEALDQWVPAVMFKSVRERFRNLEAVVFYLFKVVDNLKETVGMHSSLEAKVLLVVVVELFLYLAGGVSKKQVEVSISAQLLQK